MGRKSKTKPGHVVGFKWPKQASKPMKSVGIVRNKKGECVHCLSTRCGTVPQLDGSESWTHSTARKYGYFSRKHVTSAALESYRANKAAKAA